MKKILLILIFTVISTTGFSQWSTDPLVNNPVCTASDNQFSVTSCPDGAGGIIMAWLDWRSYPPKIYAQKINAFGQSVWASNGIQVSPNGAFPDIPGICSDAAGGCIISWVESGFVFAQRIRTDGVIMWNPSSVIVSAASSSFGIYQHKIIPAEAGASIISWLTLDFFSPISGYLFAQKLDAFGNRIWDTNDIQFSYFETNSFDLCSDGGKGAYFSFSMMDTISDDRDIFVQHVNAIGSILWPIRTCIVTAPSRQMYPSMCEDQNGGFIVAWEDHRDYSDVYASHINTAHADLWTPNGTPICTEPNYQSYPSCISDNHSGAHISWIDERPQAVAGYALYAQNINYYGLKRWTPDGKRISDKVDFVNTVGNRYNPKFTTVDALGGLISCWIGYYDNALTQYGLLAQRTDYYGTNLWDNNGVFISKGNLKSNPALIFDGGSSGCNVTWIEAKNFATSGYDVYAQHLKANSNLGNQISNGPPTVNSVAQNFPNPFNPETKISFNISEPGLVTLKIFDISGREVASLVNGFYNIGDYSVNWNAGKFSSGVYFYKFTSNSKSEIKKMMLIK